MTDLIVETTHGKVRGERHGEVGIWKGIPYAEPPFGALRFRPPRPPATWSGVRDATHFGTVAAQSRDPRIAILSGIGERVTSGEDCLFVNVFAPLDDATRIDAVLSRQLLVSLFVPARDNELHDGAVVIGKNHKIEMARALLPLSRATDLGPEFGTRHRAALGITEDTDAVSVVVSEERGEISLCFKGSIARDLEPVLLRRALVGLFAGGRATEDMAEEAEAAAEVGKALATLGESLEAHAESRAESRIEAVERAEAAR